MEKNTAPTHPPPNKITSSKIIDLLNIFFVICISKNTKVYFSLSQKRHQIQRRADNTFQLNSLSPANRVRSSTIFTDIQGGSDLYGGSVDKLLNKSRKRPIFSERALTHF